jgi:hypothetical protein
MPGFVPGIRAVQLPVDGRVKPGHDAKIKRAGQELL